MTKFLIKFTRIRNWDGHPFDWLDNGEIQSDAITDLRTREGTLSVWEIDEDHTNLEFVILAMACSRGSFDTFDYGLFDPSIVEELRIPIEEEEMNSAVPVVNKYHRNLIHLTVSSLSKLVYGVFSIIEKERMVKEQIRKLILESWSVAVDHERVNPDLRGKVEDVLNSS